MTIDLLYGRGTLSVSPPAGYYQTVKGMVDPLDILERGGDLIVASTCTTRMARTSGTPP